jgi:osmoprotectant transport system permease protein
VDEPVNLLVLVTLLVLALLSGGARAADGPLVVGSKRFTESYILGEVVAQAAQPHTAVQHRQGLGNTAVVLAALKAGAIDVYPEYLGTIDAEILKNPRPSDLATLQRQLAPLGLGVGVPLGFQNTYALAMAAPQAQALGVRRISDLAGHPALVTALSHEFLGRADGWPGLAARYQLPQRPTGIDHGLALDALAAGRIALTDIYSTDAKIAALGLVVLEDDAAYFPRYDAVLLYRLDAPTRAPAAWRAIQALQGRISAARMIQMNGDAELRGQAFATIAQGFLAAERPAFEQPVMAVVGVLQTVPSLALLALLIPLLGRIGTAPALVALSLYALLPIVRNVTTGLRQVPAGLRDAAVSLALTRAQRWRHIELPLALPVIVAGIKTAAVITVGTATIAAFIGAGGYGERIATGLALNDHATLVAGALPAALMALLTQLVFEWAERRLVRRAPSKPTATVSPPRPPSGWPRNR